MQALFRDTLRSQTAVLYRWGGELLQVGQGGYPILLLPHCPHSQRTQSFFQVFSVFSLRLIVKQAHISTIHNCPRVPESYPGGGGVSVKPPGCRRKIYTLYIEHPQKGVAAWNKL